MASKFWGIENPTQGILTLCMQMCDSLDQLSDQGILLCVYLILFFSWFLKTFRGLMAAMEIPQKERERRFE